VFGEQIAAEAASTAVLINFIYCDPRIERLYLFALNDQKHLDRLKTKLAERVRRLLLDFKGIGRLDH
jgi:hypothetical protein